MLDDLRERLLREGVKPGIVRRYVGELADHLDDLGETVPREEALRRLGSPEVLAEAVLAQPGVRSWTARAPWATLMLGPLLGLFFGTVLPLALLFVFIRGFAIDLDYGRAAFPGTWPHRAIAAISFFNEHLLPILAGWAAVAVALRQRAGLRWLLPGAVLTAFVGGGLLIVIDLHAGNPAQAAFGIGLQYKDFLTSIWGHSLEACFLDLLAILAPYALLKRRSA